MRIFVRAKTIAWSGRSASSTSTSLSALSAVFTVTWNCSTESTVSVADWTFTSTGS